MNDLQFAPNDAPRDPTFSAVPNDGNLNRLWNRDGMLNFKPAREPCLSVFIRCFDFDVGPKLGSKLNCCIQVLDHYVIANFAAKALLNRSCLSTVRYAQLNKAILRLSVLAA